jgi:hypothetical protein
MVVVASEFRDIREPGDGRKAGYVKTESVSTKKERELLLLMLLILLVLARELAKDDNLDFFGLSSVVSWTGVGGLGEMRTSGLVRERRFRNSGGMTGSVSIAAWGRIGLGAISDGAGPRSWNRCRGLSGCTKEGGMTGTPYSVMDDREFEYPDKVFPRAEDQGREYSDLSVSSVIVLRAGR